MTYRAHARELGPIALRALQTESRPRVYKLLHSSLSIESIVFSHTKLLQLQTDSTRAPITVPIYTIIYSFLRYKIPLFFYSLFKSFYRISIISYL